ncbi:hydrogenase [Helicovermis profundi]|uniref:Hydrogenase n=1 Tax=Helicovermis profundi TaxID=3065157 RepID=A0AAU9E2B5_9FIRM|nr:hydrogenase [Clostridia bacterium S502]
MLQLFIAIIIISGILISGTSRIKIVIASFTFQSLAIGLLCIGLGYTYGEEHFYILALITVLVKVIAIPYIVNVSIKKLKVNRELNLVINGYYSFILSSIYILLIAAFFKGFDNVYFKTAVFLVLIGATVIVGRRKAITQMFGFLILENGIILFEISSIKIPMVLEAGMAFEVLILALIMGIMIFHINRTFDSVNTDFLTDLKE